jgi:type IV secretory pathway VirB10-like protein
MDWLFDNFQIFALVGLALASWLKTRFDAKQAEQEERRAMEEMEERSEEFGQPQPWEVEESYQVPRSYVPAVPPPVPAAVAAEAAREADASLRHQLDLQERMRQLRQSRAVTTGGAGATRDRANAKSSPRPGDRKPSTYKKVLGDRKSLRNAIVTREILGPPLGLR